MSDAKHATALLNALPPANVLLADSGYDANCFREALEDKGIAACIPAGRRRNACSSKAAALDRGFAGAMASGSRSFGWWLSSMVVRVTGNAIDRVSLCQQNFGAGLTRNAD